MIFRSITNIAVISCVEGADEKSRQGESLKLINRITGRNSANKANVKGKSKQKRLNNWYKHFFELIVTGADKEIPKIFDLLDIRTEDFSMEDYQNVKKRLK